MNLTIDNSTLTAPSCSLKIRVYSPDYLLFKLVNWTYLRILIGPGILLNTLCLIVLSRPRLSNKSTTVVFLKFLAIFDILAITLKFIRAELNYNSVEKQKDIPFITDKFCQGLYVCMNASISISMWTIVLMSLDKAVAVSYPLKSNIWVTQKRAFCICCLASLILLCGNLPFIQLAGVRPANNGQHYCGLTKDTLIIDVITASILPIGLITVINIVIAVILRRVSHPSFDWYLSEDKIDFQSDSLEYLGKQKNTSSKVRCQSSMMSPSIVDINQAAKRRTSAQVTRMLLAVTLSLIIFNIPNTIMFLVTRIHDRRNLLHGRPCNDVSDGDIKLYKISFYSSVVQDVLSDLPHTVNFFLYCLAGRKFRSIFLREVQNCFTRIPLNGCKQRCMTQNGSFVNPDLVNAAKTKAKQQRKLSRNTSVESKTLSCISYNSKTKKIVFDDERHCESIIEIDPFIEIQIEQTY